MQLIVVNDIFSGKLLQALCWMLVHSLWLGLALTVLTGGIILSTKKQTAALRYYLLTALLLLFTIAVAVVFIIQFTHDQTTYSKTAGAAIALVTGNHTGAYNMGDHTAGFTNTVNNFFNDHAALVVWCWFLIIVFRCVQFAGGLYKIKQIKTTQLTPVSDYWMDRLVHLAATLKIKNNIQLVQSGLTKMPMVVGHFKPVILFPLGLITLLPAAEVEAVLLHELAHIRRKDYLVNLLQHFTEIVFFFNPAVLWVSSLIKTERENCCDDIAVAQAGSKRIYINALVSFQEYHLQAMQYATALGSDKNQLLQRVKRMLYNNNKTLNNMEKTFLAVCFAATTAMAILFTTATTAQTNSASNRANRDTSLPVANQQNKVLDKKIQAETSALKMQQEKLNAERQALLKKLDKLKAEQMATPGADTIQLEREMLELQEQLNRMKLQQQELLSNDAAVKSAQLQSLTQQNKLKAEQVQLQLQQEKLNAEKYNNDVQLQNHQTALQKKELALKIEAEEKQMELDMEKQKAEQRQTQIEQEEAAQEQMQAANEQKQAAMEQMQADKEQRQAAMEQRQASKDQKQSAKDQRKISKDLNKAADEQRKAAKEEARENKKQDAKE